MNSEFFGSAALPDCWCLERTTAKRSPLTVLPVEAIAQIENQNCTESGN